MSSRPRRWPCRTGRNHPSRRAHARPDGASCSNRRPEASARGHASWGARTRHHRRCCTRRVPGWRARGSPSCSAASRFDRSGQRVHASAGAPVPVHRCARRRNSSWVYGVYPVRNSFSAKQWGAGLRCPSVPRSTPGPGNHASADASAGAALAAGEDLAVQHGEPAVGNPAACPEVDQVPAPTRFSALVAIGVRR
jgi:hypothetical protein